MEEQISHIEGVEGIDMVPMMMDSNSTTFPFQDRDSDGIGKQMQWLTEEIDRFQQYASAQTDTSEQAVINRWISALESDLERPDVDGQTAWQDWL